MKNRKKSHKVTSALLFALSAILVAASIAGYAARTNGGTRENLNEMRTYAVMHAATSGVVESLVTDAGAAKLKELRARKDFRQLGGDEVNRIYEEAKAQTRAESEGKYAAALDTVDTEGLIAPINAFGAAQNVYAEARETERAAYAALYTELVKAVGDWAELTEGLDDDQLLAALQAKIPALTKPENAHLGAGFARMARAMADAANMKKRAELQTQLTSAMISSVSNWEELYDAAEDDEALWAALTARLSELKENETFKAELLTEARVCIQQAKDGVEIVAPSLSETDEPAEDAEIVVDEQYFSVSEATAALEAPADEAYDALWGALVERIPDLDSLSAKYKKLIRASIVEIAESENAGFMTRYRIYEKQSAASLLSGAAALMMKAAAYAEQVLIAGIAVLILALAVTFWGTLIRRLGVPRTIISLFFIYLLLAAQLYSISVSLMLGDVLKRVGTYGILVLAMLPGIQCGIGLNMGMTIGCISGLLATIIALQYNMTGAGALIFSCVLGALIAIPLGWAYSKMLNRMKGDEMTISTYVGFSFVSLMCIAWMLLPFTNPKIIWLLSGKGLRVTHSLLGSFAHILDNLLSFRVLGADVPTGLLLFFLMCCLAMWIFSRSKAGIAMSAAGSNPRFAEASGLNVDHMRTLGTVLSTVIAAVGIVIYSQAFGYAQLYTAPRQLGFIAASAILIGGATVTKARVGHVILGVFLFEGVLSLGQQVVNAAVAGGGLSEVMRIMISNGIILYALTQSGGVSRD